MTKASDVLDADLILALQRTGLVIVPIKATDEMLKAAFNAQRSATTPVCEDIWDAMIKEATSG